MKKIKQNSLKPTFRASYQGYGLFSIVDGSNVFVGYGTKLSAPVIVNALNLAYPAKKARRK